MCSKISALIQREIIIVCYTSYYSQTGIIATLRALVSVKHIELQKKIKIYLLDLV